MPLAERRITPADLLPDAEFAQRRKAWRAELLPIKRLRRIELGPYCTFYFECYDTMLFQVQEMLLIEKGGAEDCFFIQVGAERAMAVAEGDVERTREDGKTSSVHFLRFPLQAGHVAKFRDPGTEILIGCSHERYSHLAGLSPASRAELARDFA